MFYFVYKQIRNGKPYIALSLIGNHYFRLGLKLGAKSVKDVVPEGLSYDIIKCHTTMIGQAGANTQHTDVCAVIHSADVSAEAGNDWYWFPEEMVIKMIADSRVCLHMSTTAAKILNQVYKVQDFNKNPYMADLSYFVCRAQYKDLPATTLEGVFTEQLSLKSRPEPTTFEGSVVTTESLALDTLLAMSKRPEPMDTDGNGGASASKRAKTLIDTEVSEI